MSKFMSTWVHHRILVGFMLLIFSFMCMFCRSLFVLFNLAIVLSVLLRFTDSDYPFGIFKLFLWNILYLNHEYFKTFSVKMEIIFSYVNI